NDLGKLESLLERGVRILEADRARCPRRRLASDLQAGVAKREIQAHVAAWIAGYPAAEACDGLLDSRAAFRRQQQMHPQRRAGGPPRSAKRPSQGPRAGCRWGPGPQPATRR